VVGFTGSSIWHYLYSFPPVTEEMVNEGYADFARRFTPILDAYQELGVRFALEVHPTEIAFDTVTAKRALEAVNYHPSFGFFLPLSRSQ
jgi:sugar phosphate isomerase/epimerase